ncbi:MMPL family transporter [Oxalobacteraceae bacterium R-40]|uniref:MMPL family transporter n=1 Tax=Keguizhuia sedimenti TaxID=3064264 RepID=A0ABU1BUV7_9BURK|nr:MMPL family transporter [Oxalobacteraceae bacterium R-40]
MRNAQQEGRTAEERNGSQHNPAWQNPAKTGRPRAWSAIWIWLLALALGAVLIFRASFTADLSAFLPRNPTPEQALLVEQLKDGMVSRLILMGIEGGDADSRAALSKAMAQKLRSGSAFVSVNNGEPVNQEKDQAFFFRNRYLLSPSVTPERFTVDGLRAALTDTLDLLTSSAGMLASEMLPHDPTGEMVELLGRLDAGRQPNKVQGAWASADGKRALLLAQTRALGSDTDGQEKAIGVLRHAFEQARADLAARMPQAKNAQLLMTGPGVFGVNARNTITQEAGTLAAISTGLIICLLLFVYRSPIAVVLGLLPVLSGIVAGVAAVSLGFDVVHAITIGFGTTLVGEAIDYSIYLFIQSERGGDPQTWVKQFWPTIRLGALTSIVGFAALLFSGFPGLAQLGLYSIAGLLAAVCVTRFVLPSLMPRGFAVRDVSHIGVPVQKLLPHAPRLRGIILACAVLACAVLWVKRDGLWHSDLNALSPVSASDQQLDADLRKDIGAPDVRYLVVVKADSTEGVLQATEKISAKLQGLVDKGSLAAFESPSRYLPSMESQRMRLASLPDARELEGRLHEAAQGLPFKIKLMQPFVDSVGALAKAAKDPAALNKILLKPESLRGTSMALATDSLLISNAEGASGLMPLTAPESHVVDAEALRSAIKQAGVDKAYFIDLKTETDKLYRAYLREAIILTACGMLAIAVLLALHLRSVRRLARVLMPLAASILVVAAMLALSGQRMTILHLIGMLLIVAVGSNYALFFDQNIAADSDGKRARASNMKATTLASLILANVTTVIGFGLLGFSSVPVLNAVGQTVGPGVVLALLFAAALTMPKQADQTKSSNGNDHAS